MGGADSQCENVKIPGSGEGRILWGILIGIDGILLPTEPRKTSTYGKKIWAQLHRIMFKKKITQKVCKSQKWYLALIYERMKKKIFLP